MNAFLKVKMYEKKGLTHEQALEIVLKEVEAAADAMDLKLAECIEHLSPEDCKKLFPFNS